jgi:crotonobetainyl-CoA:carnitine CoA-transferase CaiB-like acyl-CoA transferase
MSGPLSHLTVLDLSRVLAGPWCTQILADLGATVIKIERPGAGDDTRAWGPPYLKDAQATIRPRPPTTWRAIAASCRSPSISRRATGGARARSRAPGGRAGRELQGRRLAKYGSTTRRLGVNPRLVYASITGFGQNGPYADRAGYDFIIQGMSGFMSVTGERDDLPAAARRRRDRHHRPDDGDVRDGRDPGRARASRSHGQGSGSTRCLFDSAVAMMAVMNMNYLVTGKRAARAGNAHQNIVPTRCSRARTAT